MTDEAILLRLNIIIGLLTVGVAILALAVLPAWIPVFGALFFLLVCPIVILALLRVLS
ncbi:hypothetical protein [Natrinema sp. 74]|uniref:hypothetical protein n=1 Tax=Natrinema sp. 74 TaxID=3384159 RepID=UPI0038D4F9E8